MAIPTAGAATVAAGLGVGTQNSASAMNSYRLAAVAERLAAHTQPGRQLRSAEFFNLCLCLSRGIDYAVANIEVPDKVQELPLLLKKICQRRNDLFLQAAIMVLMISVKNACKISWFSDKESQELLALANEVGSCFCSPGGISNRLDDSRSIILAIMSRFYPFMKMGQILASFEATPGYEALLVDFHISKNTTHSPSEKIWLFVAQKDNIETSACIISPQQVNFLLNGKGVERRTNVLMDMGPQMPTNVTAMLKYGTNLLQAVGQFCGHYIIVVAFMSMETLPEISMLPDYVYCGNIALDSEDSDIIEGPSRISLKCPISRTRIKTPVKGHACNHLQCFDFNNYVSINSRRPSWRCPHCNQHVCYTDIRVDQTMLKVLKEVAEDVSDVIISADGSWKAVLESDDDIDELHDKILNCQKDGSELPESAKRVPIVLDLTQDDNNVNAMETIEIEDKPPVANVQSQSATPNLPITSELINTVGANQNVASNMEYDFWSGVYLSHGSGTAMVRTDAQVGGRSESTRNISGSPVFSDAISPAPNRAEAHGNASLTTLGIQNQVSATRSLQLQQSQLINSTSTHEYGSLQRIPRHINRTPITIQVLPALSRAPIAQQRSGNSLSTLNANGSPLPPQTNLSTSSSSNSFNTVPSDIQRMPELSGSSADPHQSRNWQERSFPGQSVQQVGVAAPGQLRGSYRASSGLLGEFQNAHLQQALNMRLSQPRSPSPGLIRSPAPPLRTQTQQGAAQVGLGYSVGNMNSNSTRFMAAAHRAINMARQSPTVAVQTPTSREAASYSGNVDGGRASSVEQRLNIGGLAPAASRSETSADLASEQTWRPTGRMRGSLSGRAYSAVLSQLMIQPTQSAQAARPQTNVTTSSPSVPPRLQALLANSRNLAVSPSLNNAMTETVGMNGSFSVPPDRSNGMH